MSSRFLPAIIADKTGLLETLLTMAAAGKLGSDRVLSMCMAFRRRGIARYLLTARPADLLADLARSGAALAAHLRAPSRPMLATWQCQPWFDAAAAGDWTSAGLIRELASQSFVDELEYEEDFLYLRCLQTLAGNAFDGTQVASWIERQQALANDEAIATVRVCRALLNRDAGNLALSLEELVAQREQYYAQGIAADALIEEDCATEGAVFVEGLAILRVARLRQILPIGPLQFIPSSVLTDKTGTDCPGLNPPSAFRTP